MHAVLNPVAAAIQDTIPRGGKLFSAYKRNGQRVVVNKIGDIVVRPTPLEASMLQAAWGSNPLHHLLQSYQVRHAAAALSKLGKQLFASAPGTPASKLFQVAPTLQDPVKTGRVPHERPSMTSNVPCLTHGSCCPCCRRPR